MLLRVILAIDDAPLRRLVRKLLPPTDVVAESLRGRKHLWDRATHQSGDVIIAAHSVISHPIASSIDLAHNLPEPRSVVVISDKEKPEDHAELLAAGCDVVLYSGLPEDRLRDALAAVLDKCGKLVRHGRAARRPLAEPRLSDFVSDSPAMQRFMQMVRRVVESDTSLLILGETGVGKERLARAIHAEGRRSEGPFVAVNCGALPESLLESELFGHEEGAFTGATRSRRGAFELAHGGTIFLDEVGELALHLQVKLLRVLQDREIQRVGGEKPFTVDVRVMAASNRDLEAEVDAKRFRKDLFYRLSVVSLVVPALHERVEDIPTLVASYIDYLRPRVGREVHGIRPEAMDALGRYAWPGNVRELINVVERAMLLCVGQEITPADLPAAISGVPERGGKGPPAVSIPHSPQEVPEDWLRQSLSEVRDAIVQDVERAYLGAMLRSTGGRVGETAERAGIEPRSLYDKMKRYALHKEDFRPRKPRRK